MLQSSDNGGDGGGLNVGALIGIIIAIVILFATLLIIIVGISIYHHRKLKFRFVCIHYVSTLNIGVYCKCACAVINLSYSIWL